MDTLTYIIDNHLVAIIALFLALVTVGPYLYFQKSGSRRVRKKIVNARKMGLHEPITIHPKVDRSICIGSGGCVNTCPEKTILGMVDNKSTTICASQCVGHGACAQQCPVGAITLVFGSERRGVDIPDVSPNFESNVKRLYIAGELGGMGLIKNAVNQGQQAVGYIKKDLVEHRYSKPDCYDLVIVGSGPAGLSASLKAKKEKLNFVTLEREEQLGGSILSYPRYKVVMTSPFNIPYFGKLKKTEITKEELMELWLDIVHKTSLKISLNEQVESAKKSGDTFVIKTARREIKSRYLLLCVGRRGIPKKLDVPGEKSGKVMYRLLEPERYCDNNVVVVGGGDSAVEASMALAENNARVTLSYRKDQFTRIKQANLDKLENAVNSEKIDLLLGSNVIEISDQHVTLSQNGNSSKVANDFVFIFAGGEPPSKFLNDVGVSVITKYGEK